MCSGDSSGAKEHPTQADRLRSRTAKQMEQSCGAGDVQFGVAVRFPLGEPERAEVGRTLRGPCVFCQGGRALVRASGTMRLCMLMIRLARVSLRSSRRFSGMLPTAAR